MIPPEPRYALDLSDHKLSAPVADRDEALQKSVEGS